MSRGERHCVVDDGLVRVKIKAMLSERGQCIKAKLQPLKGEPAKISEDNGGGQ